MLNSIVPCRRQRGGFTMVELLVVITIIVILVSLVLVIVSRLQRAQKDQLIASEIPAMATAVTSYLAEFGLIGDGTDADASDFRQRPFHYLSVRIPPGAEDEPYLPLGSAQRKRALNADGDSIDDDPDNIGNLLDPYGNAYVFWARNAASRGGSTVDHTARVVIYSTMGTPEDNSDDWAMEVGTDISGAQRLDGSDIPNP